MSTVQITIDDVNHTATDDQQEAASLLRLAGRDPKDYDLFVIDKRGVETHVHDQQIVDLHDNEHFRTRHQVRFTIDGQSEKSWDDTQTATSLLELAGVDPTRYDLARVNAAGDGPEMFSGEALVDIHDGDEFVTVKRAGPVA
jgi:hypothetical protein